MSQYVNKNEKLKDMKSTAYTFCFVGLIGIIAIILVDTNQLPLTLALAQKILISIVMGLVFAIFLAIGIIAFSKIKKLKAEANSQEVTEQEVIDDFLSNYADRLSSLKELPTDGDEEADLFFTRSGIIEDILREEHPDLTDTDIDHFTELLYEQIFSKS